MLENIKALTGKHRQLYRHKGGKNYGNVSRN